MFNAPGMISSEMRYPNSTSKKKKRYITFNCKICGKIVEQVYSPSRYKQVCSSCVQHAMDTADFIEASKKIFGNRYTYEKTQFRGVIQQITLTCPVHGDFSQRAVEHLAGHGCKECALEKRKEQGLLPKEVWIKRMEAYPLISFKDTSQIKNYHGRIDLSCKIHGDFSVTLGQVGKCTYLCKECAWYNHQLQSVRTEHIGKEAYLYYVYLPEIDMYKFGVTLDKKSRFRSLGTQVVLLADGIKEYTEAVRLEHKVFIALDKYRYKGSQKLIKEGSTELFKQNVLNQIKRALQE